MSIGGLMRTSVSGMNAQATRLAGVSENIANANTTGYKRQSTEFSSLVLASGKGQYNSGVVEASTRQIVSQQGGLNYTANATSSQAVDLAVQGKGMLVVSDGAGGTFMTRAGAFVKNGNGELVNAGGFILQGYPLPMDDTTGILNGFAGLQNVNLDASQLRLKATDSGVFRVNLPKDAAAIPMVTTPATTGTATQADAFAINGYAGGDAVNFSISLNNGSDDIAVTVTPADGNVDSLTLNDIVNAINDQVAPGVASISEGRLVLTAPAPGQSISMTAATVSGPAAEGTLTGLGQLTGVAAPAITSGTLPGANDPLGTAKYTATDSIVVYDNAGQEVILDVYMTKQVNGAGNTPETNNVWEYAVFDRSKAAGGTVPFPYATGGLLTRSTVTFDPAGKLVDPQFLDVAIPNGQSMRLDLTGTSQVGNAYEPLAARVNGNPPGTVDQIEIASDGIVSARFKTGALVPLYKIPLALVESPDNLRSLPGNVFQAGSESGELLIGFGGQSGLGDLVHGALENSTVDLAGELTTMIESQRSYTANSKVFQTGSEILDVLVNLKR